MVDPAKRSLADWLAYQQTLHPRGIDLGLERVKQVWQRLGAPRPAPIVITVGGTNGKGSTVAFLEAILAAGAYRVGSYTSPHLLRYNERVRCFGVDVSDADLLAAFERVDRARGATPLTYFEFGTLAAILSLADAELDVAVLEVGLGGRLDAVNVIDADVAIVTTVDLDHQEYLGNDRDSIGREKAGIFRAARPAIIADPDPPRGLLDAVQLCAADVRRAGLDYYIDARGEGLRWRANDGTAYELPRPSLAAPCQPANAAAAIAALHALQSRVPLSAEAMARGVATANVAARLQRIPGAIETVVDVAHNPQAARMLADWLEQNPARGSTLAVLGVLADKDLEGILSPLLPLLRDWYIGGLRHVSSRGTDAETLAARIRSLAPNAVVHAYERIELAMQAAMSAATVGDRVLAFGSFFTAAAALRFVESRTR